VQDQLRSGYVLGNVLGPIEGHTSLKCSCRESAIKATVPLCKGEKAMSIRFEKDNRLAIVTIDRPEAMNALDMEHNTELDRVWAEFRDDDDL
jgi:hypothetical protein